MAAGVAQIPWYATLFRGDQFAEALARDRADRDALRRDGLHRLPQPRRQYKFKQCATFEAKADFEAYWYGPEMTTFRTIHSGWYQVPILYTFADIVAQGTTCNAPGRLLDVCANARAAAASRVRARCRRAPTGWRSGPPRATGRGRGACPATGRRRRRRTARPPPSTRSAVRRARRWRAPRRAGPRRTRRRRPSRSSGRPPTGRSTSRRRTRCPSTPGDATSTPAATTATDMTSIARARTRLAISLAPRTRERTGTSAKVIIPVRWDHSEVTSRIPAIGSSTAAGCSPTSRTAAKVWSAASPTTSGRSRRAR